ncbi:MAG: CaiB/BaiF CoA transferase family protein [Actinomycetota bacterium]
MEFSTAVAPLHGITVLDVGRVVAGPVTAFYLAALGADVIRVDGPGGDVSWRVPPFIGPDASRSQERRSDDVSVGHLRRARGKRSVVLDVTTDEGRDAFLTLADSADVVIENLRPGALAKHGCGVEDVRNRNPRLVWCSISGYGQTGPYAHRAAIDICVQAESGLLYRTGWPDTPPVRAGATVADHFGAYNAVIAVLSALRQRDLTGVGSHLDVSMLDAVSMMLWDEALDIDPIGYSERQGNGDRRGTPHGVYPTSNGSVAIVVTSDESWSDLTHIMNAPHLLRDFPRMRDRISARDTIDAQLGEWTSRHTSEQVADKLGALGIPVGVVRTGYDTLNHPQLRHRDFFEPLSAPISGIESGLFGTRLPFLIDGQSLSAGPAEPLGWSTEDLT